MRGKSGGWTRATRTATLSLLTLSGAFAGFLIGRLRGVRELERELRALRRELEQARQTQLAILPEAPFHPRLETAIRYEPAAALGGDFYSFFPARSRLGVILGDVSGKGTPAALISTSICQLAGWLRPMHDPTRFLTNLNLELLEHLPAESFASMISAFLDPESGEVVIYCAGHPPGLLHSDGEVLQTREPNLPLGLIPDVGFVPERFPFRPGDTLILYSDAFIEARNGAGEELSVEGLEELLRRYASLPTEALASKLVEETRAFGTVTDDLTLVVVRCRPRLAATSRTG